MTRARTVGPVLSAPTHNDVVKPCVVMTECAIHTVELPEGAFTAIVLSLPGKDGPAVIAILDHDEVEAHIALLRNSVEDAKRIDAGQAPRNAGLSLRRN